MIAAILRAAAFGIAVLALIDPTITVSGRSRPKLSIVVQHGPSMELPGAGGFSRRIAADRARDALAANLGGGYEIVDGVDRTARAAIVIGDRYPETPLPEDTIAATVSVAAPATRNVRIVRIDAPDAVLPATTVPIRVTLEATGLQGATTNLTIKTGSADVGQAAHTWSADRETWTADVAAVSLGEPPYTFEAVAAALPAEQSVADNRALIRVDRRSPLRVAVFEARPSWASAFVRRALEDDPRFVVSGVSQASPRAVVRTGEGSAWPPSRLDAFDAILVGGLDRLSAADVNVLERFVGMRGGSVALLADAPIPVGSPARRLVGDLTLREVLLERPAALAMADSAAGPLRIDASELLEADGLPPRSHTIAAASSSRRPVVFAVERGAGTLMFSGAMDAWRYRANAQVEFDRFWRSLVSGLAAAAAPPIAVAVSPRRPAPGERVIVSVRVRPLEREQLRERLAVSARHGNGEPIRLWPDARPGVFTGSFAADSSDRVASALVTASLADPRVSANARFVVDPSAREPNAAPLALLAASRGGVDVEAGDRARLERHIRAAVPATPMRGAVRPMRSPWWLAPFVACLAGEWWLRRRAGRR